MIILITLGMICYVAYSIFIIDKISNLYLEDWAGILLCLVCVIMPASIIGQILIWTGVLQ